MAELARQPVFIVAVAAAALGFGVMNLLMAATLADGGDVILTLVVRATFAAAVEKSDA